MTFNEVNYLYTSGQEQVSSGGKRMLSSPNVVLMENLGKNHCQIRLTIGIPISRTVNRKF
jgi:hypothetical protein